METAPRLTLAASGCSDDGRGGAMPAISRCLETRGDELKPGQKRSVGALRDTGRAMSEESTSVDLVELVRKQFEALNRRDLDGVMSSVAEDGVLDGRVNLIEGRAAIRGFLDEWFGAYEELDYELEEISHLGGGVVFAVAIQDGRLVGSDGRIRQREGWVYLWVGGSIARLMTSEVDQARAAAERLAEERG